MFATFVETIWKDIHPDSRSFIAILFALCLCFAVLSSVHGFWKVVNSLFSKPSTTCPCCEDKDENEEE